MLLTAEMIPSDGLLDIYHIGPLLNKGPLPSVFYFSLSGKDSLELDPYNQPACFLHQENVRIFSFTIPGHGPGLKNTEAIAYWAKKFYDGENPIQDFIEAAKQTIHFLIQSHFVDANNISVMGLSRGAFIATHLAAHDDRISTILGFAPLTRLDETKEFQELPSPHADALNLENLIPHLIHKTVRFYIGNLDTRVHTEDCFQFIHNLAKMAAEKRIRTLPFELSIVPSIGHHGHGTSPQTFLDGINWLKAKMGLI